MKEIDWKEKHMANKRNIDDLFKDQLKDAEFSPSNEVWKSINEQLPFPRRTQWWKYTGAFVTVASIAIVALFVSGPNPQPRSMPDYRIEFSELDAWEFNSVDEVQDQEESALAIGKSTRVPEQEGSRLISVQDIEENQLAASSISSLQMAEDSKKLSIVPLPAKRRALKYYPLIAEASLTPTSIDQVGPTPIVAKQVEPVHEKKSDPKRDKYLRKKYAVRGLHFGPVARLNSSWIVNQNTHYEFGKYELAYRMDHGYELGVSTGFDFSNSFGIQAEAIFHSAQGQRYEDLIKNENVNREVNLAYWKVPVILKYKATQIQPRSGLPVVRNFLLGLEYSHLKAAYQTVNQKIRDTRRHYSDHNMSIVLGMDFDVFVTKNLFLTMGGRATVSNNINGLRANLFDNYRKSHNFLLGIHTGFSYIIK
jgi:hypothetical protein